MNRTQHTEVTNPDITVTTRDAVRLAWLLEDSQPKQADAFRMLRNEIRRAQIVPPRRVKAEVITMHSLVRCRDSARNAFDVLMVYPGDAVEGVENVSVLSPLGIALLGLSEGQSAEYETEDGASHTVKVVKVSFEPEANLLDGGEAPLRTRRNARIGRRMDSGAQRRPKVINRLFSKLKNVQRFDRLAGDFLSAR